MNANAIRDSSRSAALGAAAHEMASCPDGTSELIRLLGEIAAQLAEHNALLLCLVETLEEAHK